MEQTILVTGSTSGFGRLMVETLARQGYRVFAGMRAAAGKNAQRQKNYARSRNENSLPCTSSKLMSRMTRPWSGPSQ